MNNRLASPRGSRAPTENCRELRHLRAGSYVPPSQARRGADLLLEASKQRRKIFAHQSCVTSWTASRTPRQRSSFDCFHVRQGSNFCQRNVFVFIPGVLSSVRLAVTGLNESALVREYHRLGAVTQAQLREDARYVSFDGGRTDVQGLRDLTIA